MGEEETVLWLWMTPIDLRRRAARWDERERYAQQLLFIVPVIAVIIVFFFSPNIISEKKDTREGKGIHEYAVAKCNNGGVTTDETNDTVIISVQTSATRANGGNE